MLTLSPGTAALLRSDALSLSAGGGAFALLMLSLQETFAARFGTYPELWDPWQELPNAAPFTLLLTACVFLIVQRLFFRPRTTILRCLSSLSAAWGFTLLLPTLTAWTDAHQGIAGPGHLPLTLLAGFLALLLMGMEALFAVCLCHKRKEGR